jgi:hypothetical protein
LFRDAASRDDFYVFGPHSSDRTAEQLMRMTDRPPARGRRRAVRSPPAALSAAFAPVRAAARHLADVEPTTMYGAPALKLHGLLLACMATNKAAEPNTVVIAVGFDQREELIAAEPAIYYLKDHYRSYPVVLVRLARIPSDALESLVREAWHFVSTQRGSGGRGRNGSKRRNGETGID